MDDGSDRRRLHDRIRDLEPADFRELLAELWRRRGYEVALEDDAVRAVSDAGYTVEIYPFYPESEVGDIEADLGASLETSLADEVIVATPAAARAEEADRPSVRSLNGRDLATLITQLEAQDLIGGDVGNAGSSPDVHAGPAFSLLAFATVGWFLTAFVLSAGPAFLPDRAASLIAAGAVGTLLCWSVLPFLVFFDATELEERDGGYRPSRALWPILALLGAGFASSYYLWRRFGYGRESGGSRR